MAPFDCRRERLLEPVGQVVAACVTNEPGEVTDGLVSDGDAREHHPAEPARVVADEHKGRSGSRRNTVSSHKPLRPPR